MRHRSGSEISMAIGLPRPATGNAQADAFKGPFGGEGSGPGGVGRVNGHTGGRPPGRSSDLPDPGRGVTISWAGRAGAKALVGAPLRRSARSGAAGESGESGLGASVLSAATGDCLPMRDLSANGSTGESAPRRPGDGARATRGGAQTPRAAGDMAESVA